jgi:hypothetical protein
VSFVQLDEGRWWWGLCMVRPLRFFVLPSLAAVSRDCAVAMLPSATPARLASATTWAGGMLLYAVVLTTSLPSRPA